MAIMLEVQDLNSAPPSEISYTQMHVKFLNKGYI